MAVKICSSCGKEFEPERDYHYLCRECYYNGNPPKKCAGIRTNGKPCKVWAEPGKDYCRYHRRQLPFFVDAANAANWLEILAKER